ncbi:MAG: Ig-like domain-containing protein [Planctomycetota bacterium]
MTQRNESKLPQSVELPATGTAPRSRKRKASRRLRSASERGRRLKMESLESRRLLAVAGGLGFDPPPVDPAIFAPQLPRNVGTVAAEDVAEIEAVAGENNTIQQAQFVNLGTGPGQDDTIDLVGDMSFSIDGQGNINADVDIYAVDLRAGDILDISITGAGASFGVLYSNGGLWFSTATNTGILYPEGSPLQNVGNAVGAQVVPEDGRYFIFATPTTNAISYTMGLRAYRPSIEAAPLGTQQKVFLDFDGHIFPGVDFPGGPPGFINVFGLADSLDLLGYFNPVTDADVNQVIDITVDGIVDQFRTLAQDGSIGSGTNGDFLNTGIGGDFGVTILNSRDHVDPGDSDPLLTRVVIGSTGTFPVDGIFGIAQSIDVGNFRPNEQVYIGLEPHWQIANTFDDNGQIAPSKSIADAASQQLAGTIVHEVGHITGMWHTDGDNFRPTLSDEGSQSLDNFAQGLGPDGIFGTSDDIIPYFDDDFFSTSRLGGPGEDLFEGIQRISAGMSHGLSTGTVGAVLSGNVYNDLNRDGVDNNEPGVAGVFVFADLNENGTREGFESSAHTDALGNYSLTVPPGLEFNILAMVPDQFIAISPPPILDALGNDTRLVHRNATGGDNSVDFGISQFTPDITGIKFADLNGNGVMDTNEPPIEGVFIYLDLDGDDRPDLGEPSSISGVDGTYVLNFPGPGTYTIREVVEPGFIQTFPTAAMGFEHTVTFNGTALTGLFDFGNLPSRDYGDAPDSYLTTVGVGGPSHGLSDEVGLGAIVDREVNGFPSVDALGDDNNNLDDEDGVTLISPLGPGGTATFEVVTRNSTGTDAFLQGWIDFDGNGVFDSSEQVFTDLVLGAGTTELSIDVPADAAVGTTYARFRYSPTPGLDVGGDADAGEVEDYQLEVQTQAAVAVDDEFSVSRNSLSNVLDVLANDFDTALNPLTIIQLNTAGTQGIVSIATDGRSLLYTPPNGFTGRDVLQYVVRDSFNNTFTANVAVNVNFQSNVPIALDDTFEISANATSFPLNVLENDVPSIFGGIQVTSVTAGDQGGLVSVNGGGQSISYTPQAGFIGTEQFDYFIEDGNGTISSAEVTVNVGVGARDDDRIDFTIQILDAVNMQPVEAVEVGDEFLVQVSVQELNNAPFDDEGVASAFLDLLYTDELVATQSTDFGDPDFPFDISFGELFLGGQLQTGNAQTPGLIDEVGSVQPISLNLTEHSEPTELFTIKMNAVSPGTAFFVSDPADAIVSETILIGEDDFLRPAEQRLGRTELRIVPVGTDFASAIDDAFMVGVDSNGVELGAANAPNRLSVLDNDNFGPTGTLEEFGIVTSPSQGTVVKNNNGTPDFLEDDFLEYFANVNASGFDSFTYLIRSQDGIRSTAEVTLAIGDEAADDDLVEISFGLVDGNGNSISSVNPGEVFGVQVLVDDLRGPFDAEFVFAAYLDMLYDSDLLTPAAPLAGSQLDFGVEFDVDFNANSAVGTAARDNIIDEFGTLILQSVAENGNVTEPNLMATVFFTANQVVQTTQTQILGSPADASPFQDTLLFDEDNPVPVSQITYNVLDITINPVSGNQNQRLNEDVNDDGNVTPVDGLIIINTIARGGEGESGGQFYTDVNGDFLTTPLDALRVINHIARGLQGSGEGEGFSDNDVRDSVITSSSGSLGGGLFDGTLDDDDDQTLDLLAGDLNGRF